MMKKVIKKIICDYDRIYVSGLLSFYEALVVVYPVRVLRSFFPCGVLRYFFPMMKKVTKKIARDYQIWLKDPCQVLNCRSSSLRSEECLHFGRTCPGPLI